MAENVIIAFERDSPPNIKTTERMAPLRYTVSKSFASLQSNCARVGPWSICMFTVHTTMLRSRLENVWVLIIAIRGENREGKQSSPPRNSIQDAME